MTTPTREEAIATLEEGQAALDTLLARLSPEQLVRPATIGGGDWSAKDLLGHIAFWEELASQALNDWRAGRTPAVEQIFAGGAATVDAANAENQERTARQDPEEVRARAATAQTTILQAIRTMSDDEWRAKSIYPTKRLTTLVELLGGILGAPKRPFGHAFAHLAELEAYVESMSAR